LYTAFLLHTRARTHTEATAVFQRQTLASALPLRTMPTRSAPPFPEPAGQPLAQAAAAAAAAAALGPARAPSASSRRPRLRLRAAPISAAQDIALLPGLGLAEHRVAGVEDRAHDQRAVLGVVVIEGHLVEAALPAPAARRTPLRCPCSRCRRRRRLCGAGARSRLRRPYLRGRLGMLSRWRLPGLATPAGRWCRGGWRCRWVVVAGSSLGLI
jgi:hypothetical protein